MPACWARPPVGSCGWARVTGVAKRRRQGLVVCRAAVSFEGFVMRARCRARARFDRPSGLAVADGLAVGLSGEVEFGVAEQAVGDPDAAAVGPARCAGHEFQAAELL